MDEDMVERLVGEFAETRRHFDVVVEEVRAEVRGGLAEVRGEVSELRGGLAEVQGGLAEVRGEVSELRGGLAEVQGGLAEVRGEVSELRGGLGEVREEVGELRGGLAEVREEVQEGRRHSEVIAEGLRSEIRLVAEGVTVVSSKLEQFHTEVKDEFAEVRSMIRFSYAELDRRLQTVERALATLEERVQRLESAA